MKRASKTEQSISATITKSAACTSVMVTATPGDVPLMIAALREAANALEQSKHTSARVEIRGKQLEGLLIGLAGQAPR